MRDFEVECASPQVFVERADRALKERGYADVVSLRLDGGGLWVWFDKMGRTELIYRIETMQSSFVARLERKRVAPFHAPFVAVFESQFETVIQEAGGRLL